MKQMRTTNLGKIKKAIRHTGKLKNSFGYLRSILYVLDLFRPALPHSFTLECFCDLK